MAGKRAKTLRAAVFPGAGVFEALALETGLRVNHDKGLRIKKIEVQFDPSQVASWAATGISVGFGVTFGDTAPAQETWISEDTAIMSWSKAITSNAVDNVTDGDLNFEWVAPLGVIVTSNQVWIWAKPINASMAGGIHFRIYVEDAVLTELEKLQLALAL
jgi:hypothetical protein